MFRCRAASHAWPRNVIALFSTYHRAWNAARYKWWSYVSDRGEENTSLPVRYRFRFVLHPLHSRKPHGLEYWPLIFGLFIIWLYNIGSLGIKRPDFRELDIYVMVTHCSTLHGDNDNLVAARKVLSVLYARRPRSHAW